MTSNYQLAGQTSKVDKQFPKVNMTLNLENLFDCHVEKLFVQSIKCLTEICPLVFLWLSLSCTGSD